MSLPLKSPQELYDDWVTALQDHAPDLTDTLDGSDIDTLAGVYSLAATEVQSRIVDRFNKTFIDLADGPEVTGGDDDLQALAVDHYGSAFSRPGSAKAIDTATFTRPGGSVATYGQVTIPAGTVVKTASDANGTQYRYTTNSVLIMTNSSAGSDTNVSVGITAVVAGSASNATAGQINVIESSLLDPTIVVSNTGNATGEDAQDDATYRETIRNLIEALAGATPAAIQKKALTVPGVITATPLEQVITAIQYNPGNNTTSGTYFRVAQPILYIADKTGTASGSLIAAVLTAINSARACGIPIIVAPATGVTVGWTASIVLNPSGPNYSTFVNNPANIVNSMIDYINNLGVGTGFVRATARTAILALWGPAGTNDITSFTNVTPSGDISSTVSQKMIAGTVGLV